MRDALKERKELAVLKVSPPQADENVGAQSIVHSNQRATQGTTFLPPAAYSVSAQTSRRKVLLHITILFQALERDEDTAAALRLISLFGGRARIICELHFNAPKPDFWEKLMEFVSRARSAEATRAQIEFRLTGPLMPLSEVLMDRLFALGVELRHVADWQSTSGHELSLSDFSDNVTEFANYGFRVPVVWYVHSENIDALPQLIDLSLQCNQNAGIEVPLITSSPYYSVRPTPGLNPPSAASYTTLLVEIYERFQHYDEVVEPMRELAQQVALGGWHPTLGTPATLKLLLRGDGEVGLYRQIPHTSSRVVSCGEILRSSFEELATGIVMASRLIDAGGLAAECANCRWRYTCGGVDGNTEAMLDPQSTICSHRMLFIEAFAYLRYETNCENQSANNHKQN